MLVVLLYVIGTSNVLVDRSDCSVSGFNTACLFAYSEVVKLIIFYKVLYKSKNKSASCCFPHITGNLELRHSVLHFSLSSGGIAY